MRISLVPPRKRGPAARSRAHEVVNGGNRAVLAPSRRMPQGSSIATKCDGHHQASDVAGMVVKHCCGRVFLTVNPSRFVLLAHLLALGARIPIAPRNDVEHLD